MIFVTIEGVDGAGKSTQATRLVNRLKGAGYDAVLFREPGCTPLSDRIRSILLHSDFAIDPLPELLLFSAARAQLVEECIRPALAKDKVVVCDRFYDSTTAYQGAGRKVADRKVADRGWISDLNRRVTGGLRPHRTWLLALSSEEALRRRAQRSAPLFEDVSVSPERPLRAAPDRMEQAGQAFYDRVAHAFDALAEAEPDRIRRLDGSMNEEALAESIWRDVQDLLAKRSGR